MMFNAFDHDKNILGVIEAKDFYYAEDHLQQYLAKEPGGYCGLGGLGVAFD